MFYSKMAYGNVYGQKELKGTVKILSDIHGVHQSGNTAALFVEKSATKKVKMQEAYRQQTAPGEE
jgi:hypothetical protein